MPIYAYKCSNCGFAKDVLQKMSDPLLTVCPSCGESTFSKQVTAAGFQLKGSGWYVTDFREGGGKKADKAGKPEGGEKGEKGGEGEQGGEKGGDKPAEKPAEKSGETTASSTPAAAPKPADKPASAPAASPSTPSSSGGGN
jgi:putative FmdB family regulatory protein